MRLALKKYEVVGFPTNISFLYNILSNGEF